MIPVKLKIQGIFSYQQEQVIDFENLVSEQIFGIFGSVGSGKSSILEAITFALYGRIEKMNSRDRINYNLMNLKSNALLIDFEFTTSKEENYRFVVSGKRNSKNFEDVPKLTKKQYKLINDKWVSDDYSAEKILGLSYDNFKRTIIIPQGKFMEFLQLGDTERTNMLKEIFNLGKFDLYNKVAVLEKDNNSHIDNLNGQLEQFKETNEDEIISNSRLLEDAKIENKSLTSLLNKKNIEFKEIESTKILFEELKKAEHRFNNLNSKKNTYLDIENNIKLYELCLINFKPLLNSNLKAVDKKKELNASKIKFESELEALTKNINEKTILFNQTKVEFENISKYKIQIEEISKLIDIKILNENIIKYSNILKDEQFKHQNLIKNKSELERIIEQFNKEIKDLEKDEKNISELSKIKEWFTKTDNLNSEIKSQKDILIIKKQELNTLNSSKNEIISNEKQQKLKINFELSNSEIIEILVSKIKEFEYKLSEAREKRDELIIKKKLEEFSSSLEKGKVCPVCGSTEHPNPINFEGIDDDIKKLNIQTQNGEKYIDDLRNYIGEFRVLENKINSQNTIIGEIESIIVKKELELEQHTKTFTWTDYKTDDKLKLISDFNNAEKTIKLIKEKREFAEKELNKHRELTNKINIHQEKINTLELKKNEFETNKNTLLGQIKTLNISTKKLQTTDELKKEQNNITLKITKTETNYNSLDKIIENLKINKAKISSSLESVNNQINEIKFEIKKLNTEIELELKKHKISDIEHVKNILSQTIDVEEEKQKIKEFELQLNSAKTILHKLKEQTKDKYFEEAKYEKIKKEILELTKNIEEINNKIGRIEAVITKLKNDLLKKKELSNKLKIKELRRDDIKTLKKLFTASGFIQYISTVYLQQLVDYANVRFHKLTKQSLSLVLGKNNNFNVIDYLNDGKQRSVKTLSGGQTFQASLSLALALAGSVQKLNKSGQNFFFLDEGFGTQDEESLRLVFNAIKSLRNENRIVGIISHVDELQDEITTHLRIVNDDKKGSIINTSW